MPDPAESITCIAEFRFDAHHSAVAALCSNFPVTRTIIGKVEFDALAVEYIRSYPPGETSLGTYGIGFPAWLNGNERENRLPDYVADVAHCDRLVIEVLHAAHPPPLSRAVFEEASVEARDRIRLRLHPATRFAWYSTPAMDMWMRGHDGFSIASGSPAKRGGALFTRQSSAVEAIRISAAEHRLLAGFRIGETLDEATRAASLLYPDADTAACLSRLVERGAFADFAGCHHA